MRCSKNCSTIYRQRVQHENLAITTYSKRLEDYGERIERERRDAYLAEATDVYDLEYRIRKLDKQAHRPSQMEEMRYW